MQDLLNVDFEWFDPQPAVDFHGLKTLLRQLFDIDNQLFDLSALADLILSQPMLGSTVKCDGNESDPYAFLTVLNLHQHRETPVIRQLSEYLILKSRASDGTALRQLGTLLAPTSDAQVGLILQERFINMPHQVVPPMYNMLLEEMTWAVDDKEPYRFTHYLIVSKTYTEVESLLDAQEDRPGKKLKQGAAAKPAERFYFHPEDEVWQKHALDVHAFGYSTQADEGAADAKRAFQDAGIMPQGHLVLMDKAGFENAVKDVNEFLGGA